jgi:hypothetical protein
VSDRSWKAFERDVARLFGGRRFWANAGEALDVESETVVAQCKLVKRLSLEELTRLAEAVEREALLKFKAGVVAVKVRRGRGRSSQMLLVCTERVWRALNGSADQGTGEETPR